MREGMRRRWAQTQSFRLGGDAAPSSNLGEVDGTSNELIGAAKLRFRDLNKLDRGAKNGGAHDKTIRFSNSSRQETMVETTTMWSPGTE